MRLLSLDLEKFGAFGGVRLTFRPDARVHVVYGVNGAGKSTALAAAGALLYGLPRKPHGQPYPLAFRFGENDLRVGAEIVARDGRTLRFRRRKGLKNTLLDADDKPIPEDSLAPFLGAVGEEVFGRSFGLDAAALRDGGAAMLSADGDLGASMIAAASGLRGLADLRRSLESEADLVFAPRAAKDRRFYRALDRFETARKAIREKELLVDKWRKLNADIEALDSELARLRAERRAGVEERSRLARARRVAPALREIAATEAALAEFADAPAFAPGALGGLETALAETNEAAAQAERIRVDETQLVDELAAISFNQAVLEEAAAIEELFGASGGHAAARRDLPRIQSEAEQFLVEQQRHAGALGLADVRLLETRAPTAAALATMRALISEGRKREAANAERAASLAAERATFQASQLAHEAQGEAIDPTPYRETLASLGKIGETARALAKSRAELAGDARQLGEFVARLDPRIVDLDAIARVPPPGADDLAQFAKEFDSIEREARDAGAHQVKVEGEIAEINERLAGLAAGGPLATESVIDEARVARDGTWRELRSALLKTADAPPEADIPSAICDFERLSERADRLADAASRAAERLAAYALENRRLDERTRALALALAAVNRAEARRQDVERRWLELWEAVSVVPRSPPDMRAWRDMTLQALDRRARLTARRIELETGEQDLARVEPILRAIADEIGARPHEGLDPARLAERVERRLEEIGRAWQAVRERDVALREGELRLRKSAADGEEAGRRLAEWRERWAKAASAIGLDSGAAIEAAEAAIAIWDKAANAADNRLNRLGRVNGMKRILEDFETRANDLVERCARELAGQPAEIAARRLHDGLVAERGAQVLHAAARERLVSAERRRAQAQTRAAAAVAALAKAAAALPAGTDLAGAAAREGERRRLLAMLADLRGSLRDLGDGLDEARLREEAAAFDPDAAQARIAELGHTDDELGRRENERYAERDRLTRDRAALEGGVGAEVAWQQRRNAETELVDSARRWLVLKAASQLLGAALERHSAERRDPLMIRAGEVFVTLTGGDFSGLDESYGDDDQPRLEARRRDGVRVPVPALSDGERDQLYLALRLAYVEDYATRAEAPPFLGDDLFASFDDARTAHGLDALAAVGDRVQTILFTHHLHVIEAARARLGASADIISIG